MFWNALSRKGKIGDTKEEDMETVVAIHNSMNEGTWGKVLEWEGVLGEGVPKLSRFMGRPSDLSPKAMFKHYFLSHPLPFDRHDWTVLRPDGTQVRYVIDYYHDVHAENEDTTIEDLQLGNKGVNSLLVDVRPALDGPAELWGRMVSMPLARRGCDTIFDCILNGGEGKSKKSQFEPLPMMPTQTLKSSMAESKEVWDNIQKSVKGEACDSNSMDRVTKKEAVKIAESFARILKQCKDVQEDLKNCQSEEECSKAFMGMTVCAGQTMCPLQHKSFVETLNSGSEGGEMNDAKINAAFDILGECVAKYDQRASGAKKEFPEVFERIIKK
jgi:cytochrome c heme-lyase